MICKRLSKGSSEGYARKYLNILFIFYIVGVYVSILDECSHCSHIPDPLHIYRLSSSLPIVLCGWRVHSFPSSLSATDDAFVPRVSASRACARSSSAWSFVFLFSHTPASIAPYIQPEDNNPLILSSNHINL